MPHRHRPPVLLLLIALEKGAKAVGFLLLGLIAIRLIRHPAELTAWVSAVHVDPEGRLIHRVIAYVLAMNPHTLRAFGIGAFVYAVVYSVEAVGLAMDVNWVEWLTVVTTAGYIPFEIHHLVHKPGVLAVVVMLINVLGLIYLLHRLREKHRAWRLASGGSAKTHEGELHS